MSAPLHVLAHAAVLPAAPASPADLSGLERFEQPRSLRRVDHFCRLALLAAHNCLERAGGAPCEPDALGLVLATGYGPVRTSFDFSDSMQDFGPDLASPTAFSTSVHNIAASVISLRLGLTGPVHTLAQGESSLAGALHVARAWLASGRVERVLLGAVDEYVPFLEQLLSFAPQSSPPCAEGALFLLLGREGGFARLPGWGMGFGAAPSPPPGCRALREGNEGVGPYPLAAHPAGPVFALNRALEELRGAPGLRETLRCERLFSRDGWSHVHAQRA